MVNLFIANFWSITSGDLRATFLSFGTVVYGHVVYEKATKRPKGFAYVEMEDTDHAINAINTLNGMVGQLMLRLLHRRITDKKRTLKNIEYVKCN